MKWNVLAKDNRDVIKTLLANRKLKTKKEIEDFLDPPNPSSYSASDLDINSTQLKKAILRIKLAIKNKEPIVVYGDYDADGICATAIMWETLNRLKASVLPFIPQREKEGYGLSIEGLKNIDPKTKLVITVDSGVVAHEAVDFAKKMGIDVIILDHHEKPKKLPETLAIIHTDQLCASGIAYFVAKHFDYDGLDLATIATVTDLMDLRGPNRSLVKYGLKALDQTARPGLRALLEVAGIKNVGTYEIGYMIGPRLNASGRIDSALTALRLLCTKDKSRAMELAQALNKINKDRQDLLDQQTVHALESQSAKAKKLTEKIIVIDHESYHQGVIGLIAGKLVERYYLPAIVIAKGDKISKASARSISGFNIIEAIRASEKLLVNAGGHPMAAGFTIETAKISNFKLEISNYVNKKITSEILEKTLKIDCLLDLDLVSLNLYNKLQQLAPYGIGNPEPIFASEVTVQNIRTVGQDGKHLKLIVSGLDAIAFNQGILVSKLRIGDKIKIAYCLALNSYNGADKIQLKIKAINHGESLKEN